jgi:serine/threonine protein kinase
MKPADHQRLVEIFNGALELPTGERPQFLSRACGPDAGLRAEVESLLAFHDDGFLEKNVSESVFEVIRGGLLPDDVVGGQYRIVERIGGGGMGEVYLAEDLTLGRKVALKALAREFREDERRLQSFQKEARAASSLNHKHIVTVHAFLDVGDKSFIVTEYIDGETLREKLRSGPLDVPTALKVTRQIASALEAAHAGGVVHRDVKPENVIIRRDGDAKVLDFGIATLATREAPSEEPHPTGLNKGEGLSGFGTASYMSPEQVCKQETDLRTDIWSLGVCLYEMLAGAPPFKDQTPIETIASILKVEPAPLGQHIPESLKAIVRRALQKKPDRRYQTASEFLSDLGNSSTTSYSGATTFGEWWKTSGKKIAVRLLTCAATSILLSAALALAIYVSDPSHSDSSKKWAAQAAKAVGCIFHLIAITFAYVYLRRNPGPEGFRDLRYDITEGRLKSHITYSTGYKEVDDWERAKNIAKGALKHYREAFIWLLFAWIFLYLWALVSLFDFEGKDSIVATVFTLANNLNTLCIWLCFDILNETITIGNETQNRNGIIVTEGRRWPKGFIPAAFGVIFWLILELWLTSDPAPQAELFHYISRVVSGIAGGVAMALFVGRFQSKFLKSPPWLVLILFLYTVIQALFIFYGGKSPLEQGAAAAVMNAALVLKCLLILYMFWLFQSGRLLFYLVRVRRASEQVDREWQNFREVLGQGG